MEENVENSNLQTDNKLWEKLESFGLGIEDRENWGCRLFQVVDYNKDEILFERQSLQDLFEVMKKDVKFKQKTQLTLEEIEAWQKIELAEKIGIAEAESQMDEEAKHSTPDADELGEGVFCFDHVPVGTYRVSERKMSIHGVEPAVKAQIWRTDDEIEVVPTITSYDKNVLKESDFNLIELWSREQLESLLKEFALEMNCTRPSSLRPKGRETEFGDWSHADHSDLSSAVERFINGQNN